MLTHRLFKFKFMGVFMSRIPAELIQDIVQRCDLVELVSSRIKLKKRGSQYWACCPFHQEKTASFSVHSVKQFFYCFGCGAKGSAIDFIMQYDRLDFIETMHMLAEKVGVALQYQEGNPQQQTAPIYACLDAAKGYFQQQLPQQPTVIAYLKQRGLTGVIAKRYQLGYAPKLSQSQLESVLSMPSEQLQSAGLCKRSQQSDNQYYPFFRQRIMFPIRDIRGRTLGFGGRVIQAELQPKYLNSPETAVFHKAHELYGLYEALQHNRQLDYLMLVEGYMDVISLAQHGELKAVASLGTAIGEKHFQKLWRHTSHIVCCFDGDSAGQKAAWKALQCALPLLQQGRQVSFIHLPSGQDPDSYIKQHGLRSWKALVQKAESLSDFFLRYLQQQYPLRHMDDRVAFAHHASKLITNVPVGLFKNALCRRLADLTQLDAEQLAEASLGHVAPDGQTSALGNALALAQSQLEPRNLVERALALLLQQPELALQPTVDVQMLQQLKLPHAAILLEVMHHCLQSAQSSLGAIIARYQQQSSLKDLLCQLAFTYHELDPQSRSQEFLHVMFKLKQTVLEQKISGLMAQAELGVLSDEHKQQLQQLIFQKKHLKVGETD